MDAHIATAVVRLRLNVNFGDPVTPALKMIERYRPCDRTPHRTYRAYRSARGVDDTELPTDLGEVGHGEDVRRPARTTDRRRALARG